ncbi:TPA: hypothetical protein ACNEJR_004678 [Escherichia coli]
MKDLIKRVAALPDDRCYSLDEYAHLRELRAAISPDDPIPIRRLHVMAKVAHGRGEEAEDALAVLHAAHRQAQTWEHPPIWDLAVQHIRRGKSLRAVCKWGNDFTPILVRRAAAMAGANERERERKLKRLQTDAVLAKAQGIMERGVRMHDLKILGLHRAVKDKLEARVTPARIWRGLVALEKRLNR